MTHPPAAATTPLAPTEGGIVVVAPTSDELPTAARHHAKAIAIHLPPSSLPLTHATAPPPGRHYTAVIHHVSLRRTLKALDEHRITAVIAGSGHGISLAEQIAAALGLPANCPRTAHVRRDRHEQAQVLLDAGLPAPHSTRTSNMTIALRWSRFVRASEYVLAPANTAVAGAHLCRTAADVRLAWPVLQRTARHRGGGDELVLQERLHGPQYLVHTHTHPGLDGPATHTLTDLWTSTRFTNLLPDRDDQLDPRGQLAQTMSTYLQPVLDHIGVHAGPARARIVHDPERGPILLSLQTTDATPLTGYRAGQHTTRVTLIAPEDAVIDSVTLRKLTSLPSVTAVTSTLAPGAPVTRTTDSDTSPGALLLASPTPEAITADHHAIRRAEARGLYHLA